MNKEALINFWDIAKNAKSVEKKMISEWVWLRCKMRTALEWGSTVHFLQGEDMTTWSAHADACEAYPDQMIISIAFRPGDAIYEAVRHHV
jgi:hypothetical protein